MNGRCILTLWQRSIHKWIGILKREKRDKHTFSIAEQLLLSALAGMSPNETLLSVRRPNFGDSPRNIAFMRSNIPDVPDADGVGDIECAFSSFIV